MTKKIALILYPPFFTTVFNAKKYIHNVISCKELIHFLDKLPTSEQTTDYHGQYLLGHENYKGIIRDYLDNNFILDVIEQEHFKNNFNQIRKMYDGYDFLLSSHMPFSVVDNLIQSGKTVTGWIPPAMSGKHYQYLLISSNIQTRHLLPRLMIVSQKGHLRAINQKMIDQWFPSTFLMVKSIYASRSKMPDGTDYPVLKKKEWPRFKAMALENNAWFSGANGLIISEFIETKDIYLNKNNAVVHKVHLSTGSDFGDKAKWPLDCYKMSGKVDLAKVKNKAYIPYGEAFELESWQQGNLDTYRNDLYALSEEYHPLPCLFAFDFMIDNMGHLYYLEANKIAGTFLINQGMKSPLERYMNTICNQYSEKNNLPLHFKALVSKYNEIVIRLNGFRKI